MKSFFKTIIDYLLRTLSRWLTFESKKIAAQKKLEEIKDEVKTVPLDNIDQLTDFSELPKSNVTRIDKNTKSNSPKTRKSRVRKVQRKRRR